MRIHFFLLSIFALLFLVRYVVHLVREYRKTEDKRRFWTFRRFRYAIMLALVVGIPVLLVNLLLPIFLPEPLYSPFDINMETIWWIAVPVSLLISLVWLIFMYRLDIFEREEWLYLFLTFLFAGLAAWFPARWMYSWVEMQGIDILERSSWFYDLLHLVFITGGIEETCKIVPVLMMLLNRDTSIDEPYDYILYGSVSALGFAFVENINYLSYSYLGSIEVRALYATVAHMTYTSIVCYGMMLWRFKLTRLKGIVIIPVSFLLAMAVHGFYNFLLRYPPGAEYRIIHILFFLLSVHLWIIMQNNALNVSNYYSPGITPNNDRLRSYLILSLTGLMMLNYLFNNLFFGTDKPIHAFLLRSLPIGYLIIYLSFGLSRYKIVPDRLDPFRVPVDFLIPKPKVVKQEVAAIAEEESRE